MIDEIFDRGYQAARANMNAGIADAFSSIGQTLGDSLTVLHRIEWSAPWSAPRRRARRA